MAETNQLIYNIAMTWDKLLKNKKNKINHLKWKTVIGKITNLQADNNLKNLKKRKLKNNKMRGNLQKRYKVGTKIIKEVSEELKYLTAISKKIEWYDDRINLF